MWTLYDVSLKKENNWGARIVREPTLGLISIANAKRHYTFKLKNSTLEHLCNLAEVGWFAPPNLTSTGTPSNCVLPFCHSAHQFDLFPLSDVIALE